MLFRSIKSLIPLHFCRNDKARGGNETCRNTDCTANKSNGNINSFRISKTYRNVKSPRKRFICVLYVDTVFERKCEFSLCCYVPILWNALSLLCMYIHKNRVKIMFRFCSPPTLIKRPLSHTILSQEITRTDVILSYSIYK